MPDNTQGEDALHYTYDPSGNRIKKESKEGATFYGYNEKNQLICEEGIHGKQVFTYSRQGSILKEESQAGTRRFAYNSRNQQIRVELEDKRVQENRYDADGLRFEMKENEKLLRFAYHKGELYFESSETSQTSYHLGAGIEGFTRDQKTSYLHQDEQLSTALVTDELGAVQNYYLYGAFGEERESAEQTPNRIRYTGQQYDGTTGQYYLRARYYNPILGRFMQEDVYQGDGLNLYAYCENNPVMYYDPSGYEGCPPGARHGGSGQGGAIPDGYYQDQNGRWHRLNGEYAGNVEVGLPSLERNRGQGGGGRLGTEETRAQNKAIGDYLNERGFTVTGGGGQRQEEYLPV